MKYRRAICIGIAVICSVLAFAVIQCRYRNGSYFHIEETEEYEPSEGEDIFLSGDDEYLFTLRDPFQTVENMIFEFHKMNGHDEGEMQVTIFQGEEVIYEYSIPLYVFQEDVFYLYTQNLEDWIPKQEHRIMISVKDVTGQGISLGCAGRDYLNVERVTRNGERMEGVFPVIGIRGTRQVLSREYHRDLAKWGILTICVGLLLFLERWLSDRGLYQKLRGLLMSLRGRIRQKGKAVRCLVWVLPGLLLLIVVMGWLLRDRLVLEDSQQYWSTDVIVSFVNIQVKDGEIRQSFRARTDELTQFIMGFDNYSQEDTDVLHVELADSRDRVYYQWSACVGKLSGQTFYLLAEPEESLKKGRIYYWRIRLEEGSSGITVRAIDNPAGSTGLLPLKINGQEQEKTVLYCAQTYTFRHHYLYQWLAMWVGMVCFLGVVLLAQAPRILGYIRAFLFCLAPSVSYIVVESLSGNLETITPVNGLINCVLIAAVYLLLYALMGRYAFVTAGILFWLVGVGNYFVYLFRGSELLFSDIHSISTAATVAGHYVFEPTAPLTTACIITVAMLWAYGMTHTEGAPALSCRRLLVRGGLGCCGLLLIWCCMKVPSGIRGTFNFLNLHKSFTNFGWCYSNAILQRHSRLEKPEGYSEKKVQEIVEALEYGKSDPSATVPENLIVIMNESLCDLGVLGNVQTSRDPLAFIHSLEENTVKGRLYVQVLGGSTCITEYEFLTGNTAHFLRPGTIPYSVLCKDREAGLVQTLKQQNFHTVAMHPYGSTNWNRDKVYPAMGFDQFLSQEDFEGSECIRNYVSDRADYEKIIELFEKKDRSKGLFVFNVTMQNHGGYDVNNGLVDKSVTLENLDCSVADTYLSLLYESDQAFEELIAYFSQVEEPTMIVLFGDHQPSLPPEFYDEVMGKDAEHRTEEEESLKYETFYLIWTNYESDFVEKPVISTNFLSSYVLDCAGLQGTAYHRFLRCQQEKVSALGKYGVWLKERGYVPYGDLEEDMLREYRILQYMRLMDRRSGQYGIFTQVGP